MNEIFVVSPWYLKKRTDGKRGINHINMQWNVNHLICIGWILWCVVWLLLPYLFLIRFDWGCSVKFGKIYSSSVEKGVIILQMPRFKQSNKYKYGWNSENACNTRGLMAKRLRYPLNRCSIVRYWGNLKAIYLKLEIVLCGNAMRLIWCSVALVWQPPHWIDWD